MLDTQALADALVDWAVATCPAILGAYNHPHAQKENDADGKVLFPDIAAEIQSTRTVREDNEHFPELTIQQLLLRVHTFSLMFVVDPNDPEQATKDLEGIIDKLTEELVGDKSLGDRVVRASPITTASYEPPFVEFADGTRGRFATLEITVADIIDEED